MVSEGELLEVIGEVFDPEMKISVTELGLIYGVEIEGDHVEIKMTLTSPGCPVAPELMASVHRSALSLDEIKSVQVNLTFSPPWDPRIHASEDAKFEMGIFD